MPAQTTEKSASISRARASERRARSIAAAPRLGQRAGERAELELGVVEEQRDDGDQPDAGVAGEALPELDVVLVDLVGIVRLEAGEPVLRQAGGDLQPLLEVEVGLVLGVEAAVEGREEPDAGREPELQLEALEVAHQLLGRAPDRLRAKIYQGHDVPPRLRARLSGSG